MTSDIDTEQAALIASLPPSAWLEHGTPHPKNVYENAAKKGGTSKTSLTAIEADASARFGLNVLVIDGDPQGNVSLALDSQVQLKEQGRRKLGDKPILVPDRLTLVEVMDADANGVIDEAFQLVPWEYNPTLPFSRGGPLVQNRIGKIGLIPSYKALEADAEEWTLDHIKRLSRALLNPREPNGIAPNARWDLVIIDPPPGGGKIGRTLAKAAHRVKIVTDGEPFSMGAIGETLEFLHDVRDRWDHPELIVDGAIFTEYKPGLLETQAQIKDFEEARAKKDSQEAQVEIWKPRLPARTVIPRSQSYRAPMSALLADKNSRQPASLVCQVGEAIVLQMLHKTGHPRAAELQARWADARPGKLSPYVTGAWEQEEQEELG